MQMDKLHRASFLLLRYALALVFLWFGLLKLFGVSPVIDVIRNVYPWMADNQVLFLLLAALEIAIGVGLLIPRLAVPSAWIMVGHLVLATFGVLFSSQAFVDHFPYLSVVGEFVVKNFVLIAGAMLIVVYEKDAETRRS